MAVAKQQSEAWRKALDGVPDSLRMLLEINNTENVPEYSEKQKKQYNDAIKAYEHIGNGVSWSQFEWKTYDTQMTVTFEDSVKLDIENPIIRINTAFKGCSSLEKISVLPRIYHN